MTAPPLLVALLACHNRRALTLECLDGYFAQNVGDVQLACVVCDDGSTDGTAEAIAAAYPDRVDIVPGDGDLYWAAAMALAERRAMRRSPDYLLWLNDDTTLIVMLWPGCSLCPCARHVRSSSGPREILRRERSPTEAAADPVDGMCNACTACPVPALPRRRTRSTAMSSSSRGRSGMQSGRSTTCGHTPMPTTTTACGRGNTGSTSCRQRAPWPRARQICPLPMVWADSEHGSTTSTPSAARGEPRSASGEGMRVLAGRSWLRGRKWRGSLAGRAERVDE